MNEKGLTLTELLAVIIILSVLVLIASTSVTSVIKSSKNDLYSTQIQLIKSAAEAWGSDNINRLPSKGTCVYLRLRELKRYGLLDESITNPKTDNEFSDELKIKISSELTNYGLENITYEVDGDVSGCTPVYVCTAVNTLNASYDKANQLIGAIPNERMDYKTIKYKPGDEYICEVKENTYYHFYILSTNNVSGDIITNESSDKIVQSINLLMDRNIYYDSSNDISASSSSSNIGLTRWYSIEDNSNGPVEAMLYLHNATKSWNNIPNIIMNYIDEGGTYGKIITDKKTLKTTITKLDETTVTDSEGNIFSIQNLKARMPSHNEMLLQEVGCKEYGTVEETNYGSCKLWAVNYQNDIETIYSSGHSIKGIAGYWTLSSSTGDVSNRAWVVFPLGVSREVFVYSYSGIRPVITIPLNIISH